MIDDIVCKEEMAASKTRLSEFISGKELSMLIRSKDNKLLMQVDKELLERWKAQFVDVSKVSAINTNPKSVKFIVFQPSKPWSSSTSKLTMFAKQSKILKPKKKENLEPIKKSLGISTEYLLKFCNRIMEDQKVQNDRKQTYIDKLPKKGWHDIILNLENEFRLFINVCTKSELLQ